MKAWQFYGFGDMRLDEVADPVCGAEEVIVEPLCVQPSVTEAQLAQGIPTLAYEWQRGRSSPAVSVRSAARNAATSAEKVR
jgi:hypothetical protein